MKRNGFLGRFPLVLGIAVALDAPVPILAATFTNDTLIGFSEKTYDGQDIMVGPCMLTVDGPHAFASLLIQAGGILTHSSPTNGFLVGLNLVVSNSVRVALGGAISGDGRGDPGGAGPGAGGRFESVTNTSGGGGGYGGFGGGGLGGAAGGVVYGSFNSAPTPGSGGGAGVDATAGGAGGGVVNLTVRGLLQVDGTVSASGTAGTALGDGGGSGGSILLTVASLAGTGVIAANGGPGQLPLGGGGGGGRIVVNFGTNSFAGSLQAHGGQGAVAGGAGTILTQATAGSPGALVVDNGGLSAPSITPLSFLAFGCDLAVLGGARADPSSDGDFRNLEVGSNSWLAFPPAQAGAWQSLFVSSNATIAAGGGITLDGAGNAAGQGYGPGKTGSSEQSGQDGATGGGGGNGGAGGASAFGGAGGYSYFTDFANPIEPGSGGGNGRGNGTNNAGGAGGGGLLMSVGGRLVQDGTISANGAAGIGEGSGGGSGGSISLTVGSLSGNGLISANGGDGDVPYGGGGGGGQIAVLSTNAPNPFADFTGGLEARGGAGAQYGGAGTIFLRPGRSNLAQLVIENGGVQGAVTTLYGAQNALSNLNDLTVSGGALVLPYSLSGPTTIRNLLVGSNSWLTISNLSPVVQQSPNGGVPLALTVMSNAIVQAGGGIALDGGGGWWWGVPGAGGYLGSGYYGGGGGGYGGGGGAGLSGPGGATYGSTAAPTDLGGAGGGAPIEPYNLNAGAGGGALRLTVGGTLAVDGKLSADGAPGAATGGGAGGSVWLAARTLTGTGLISANGGRGDAADGGGGGGRIALYFTTNQFKGVISAHGGAGFNYGGAGTIYLRASNSPLARVIVDNGGIRGPGSLLSLTNGPTLDLTVSGGGQAYLAGSSQLTNLYIGPLSSLGYSNSSTQGQLTVLGNAYIQPGGALSVDGLGYPAGQGAGTGSNLVNAASPSGGGGGHGGCGGASALGAAGGLAYGSISAPSEPGSGGALGIGQGTNSGGAGGGLLSLKVTGALALNGSLSANGANATWLGGGGGAGGSLVLDVATLSGSGVIAANGGAGDPPNGGGGGGRIALNIKRNLFKGTISAHGGQGLSAGGAGTIYTGAVSAPSGSVVVDNGGLSGAGTLLATPEAFNLTISGAAVVYPTPQTPALLVSSLLVDSGGGLTYLSGETNLDLTVVGSATVGSNGWITADGRGYSGTNGGSGAGLMPYGYIGTGGGYGGMGGSSLNSVPGGGTYGSAQQPVNWGSRGGIIPAYPNSSQGGGSIRLRVGRLLTVNGKLTADGNGATYQGAGGGAGGSVWVTASQLAGSGLIAAAGGAGGANGGGGGGGGRIAIYSGKTNHFTGSIRAPGGSGQTPGQNGTVFFSSVVGPANVLTQSRPGAVSFAVSNPRLSDVTGELANQDFRMVTPAVVPLTAQAQGSNLRLSWQGIAGATHQLLWSTNLLDWLPCGRAMIGTNGPMSLAVPVEAGTGRFFRFGSAQ